MKHFYSFESKAWVHTTALRALIESNFSTEAHFNQRSLCITVGKNNVKDIGFIHQTLNYETEEKVFSSEQEISYHFENKIDTIPIQALKMPINPTIT